MQIACKYIIKLIIHIIKCIIDINLIVLIILIYNSNHKYHDTLHTEICIKIFIRFQIHNCTSMTYFSLSSISLRAAEKDRNMYEVCKVAVKFVSKAVQLWE